MPGRVPKPPDQRAGRHKPQRGEWLATPGVGWQHGRIPKPPDGLTDASRVAWRTWFRSWFASHWTPDDLPGLRAVVQLYDACERYAADPYEAKTTPRGDTVYVLRPNPASERRQMMDTYGITPKGQQDRRWAAPKAAEPTAPAAEEETGPYTGLSLVKAG